MKTLLFQGSLDQSVILIDVPNALPSANTSQLDHIQKDIKVVLDQINEVIVTQIAQQKQISLISSVHAESKATLDAILHHLQKEQALEKQALEKFDLQLSLPIISVEEISALEKMLKDETAFKKKMVRN